MPPGSRSRRRGIALVLVLACVVLLTVMILAYLASIGTELRSSRFYADGGSVKLLAQSTGDLVMAEIRDATSNGSLCWASQPGMIRTYDNTGAAVGYYKLYSDATMTGTGAFDYTGDQVPSDWYSQKGVYIDLNQPISTTITGTTTYQYPIVDGDTADLIPATSVPAAAAVPNSSALVMGPSLIASGPYQNYPQILGFAVNSPTATGTITPTPVDPSSINHVPMPVRWLYVLKNGNIISPSGVSSNVVSFAGSTLPTAANPIVGRIAFWTDDETSKINLNTAGESVNITGTSTVWDTPRVDTSPDILLSRFQAAQNEFQRYPGHPATVSLSSVFGNLSTDPTFPENIYSLAPRLTPSVTSGTFNFGNGYTPPAGYGSKEGTQYAKFPLTLTSRPLYADLDEFLYQGTTIASGGTRLLNSALTGASTIDQSMIRRAEFFVTANSHAPDVNVFNQPRVGIWPVSSSAAKWSPYDRLISFCSTINGYPYCFQRANPNDEYADLPTTTSTGTGFGNLNRNRNVMEYLRTLAAQPFPGFGGSFADTTKGKYKATDVMTDSGIGGTEFDQILTEIFDYIRSTNLVDGSATPSGSFTATVSSPSIGAAPYNPGIGQVVPIVDQYQNKNTRGFGRFPTIHSASLIFFPLQNGFVPTKSGTTVVNTRAPTQFQAVLVLQMFDPSQAFPLNIPWYQIQVNGLSGLKWSGFAEGAKQMFASDTAVIGNPYGGNFVTGQNEDRQIGGMSDFRRLLVSSASFGGYNAYNPSGTGSNAYAPAGGTYSTTANSGNLFSNPYPTTPVASSTTYTAASPAPTAAAAVPSLVGTATFSFTGAPLTFKIYSNSAGGAPYQLLQTISFTFPSDNNGTMPIPAFSGTISGTDVPQPTVTHVPLNAGFNSTATDGNNAGWQLWSNRVSDLANLSGVSSGIAYNFYSISLISDGDVIRSAMPMNGDLRLLAARQTITQNDGDSYFFTKHPGFGTGVQFAHDLQDDLGRIAEWAGPCYGSGITYGLGSGIVKRGGSGGALVSINSSDTPHLTQAYGGLNPSYALGVTWYPEYWGLMDTSGYDGSRWSDIPTQRGAFVGDISGTTTSASSGAVLGDWDTGMGNLKDGPYINKADEGSNSVSWGTSGAYYDPTSYTNPGAAFFSPNRMIPSAGMFGSLPSGVLEEKPWQTLLFRPGPAGHPGLGTSVSGPGDFGPPYSQPPDHLLLDLFNMPVVEPYAISEPLSTAGRINMNYQIVPFTYITRNTGIQAVLRSASVMTIPNTDGTAYKQPLNPGSWPSPSVGNYRNALNVPATLAQFDARMTTKKDLFRSASEICSIDLVPANFTTPVDSPGTAAWRADMDTLWKSYALTGDNERERPYANMYPLLTTKSNTFTIHFRVQTLKQAVAANAPAASWNTWTEGAGVVTAEYRGSQIIERYVDPSDTTIPDFTAGTSTSQTLAPYYKFRVLSNKQFAP